MRLRSVVPVLLSLLGACCGGPDESRVTLSRRPIINGVTDDTHTAVVALTASSSWFRYEFCTGTLIAPRVVLTAGHCVMESGMAVDSIEVFFGTNVRGSGQVIGVVDGYVHPDYSVAPNGAPLFNVAVLILGEDAPVAPMAWQRTPLGDITGQTVTLVGYGVTDATRQSGSGTRRMVDAVVTSFDEMFFYYGDGVSGTCQGDSGGPMLLDQGGVPTVIGVTSFGDETCVQLGANTRVDTFADFIRPYAAMPVTVAFTAPADAATVGPTFSATVDAASDADIAQVDLYLDDALAGSLTAPPWTFDLADVPEGAHQLTAKARANDDGTGEALLHVTVATAPVGDYCAADSDCQGGQCAEAETGQGYCTQPCATTADCPNEAACEAGQCGAPGSATSPPDGSSSRGRGCRLGGAASNGAPGLLVLVLLALLASRRRD